jgi:membrane protein DedA with SNARE-associated domain
MKLPWFKRIGMFIVPTTIVGWLILIAGLAYAVYVFIDIDSRSHSASDTLRPFIIQLLIIAAVYYLIAWLTSKTPKAE